MLNRCTCAALVGFVLLASVLVAMGPFGAGSMFDEGPLPERAQIEFVTQPVVLASDVPNFELALVSVSGLVGVLPLTKRNFLLSTAVNRVIDAKPLELCLLSTSHYSSEL
jgi:hypothetical protein